jgi:molybdate transport repressor ModE-like protein
MRNADCWEALEVRHLRAFAAVADTGSFAEAARELGYTQSAISQQILALERIVGAPVLRRHPGGRRPAELTETGRVLLAHGRPLLARVQAAQADLAGLALGEAGRVAVGTIQSFGAQILPGVLARYRAVHPGVDVEIRQSIDVDELFDGVESGELDLCFTVQPVAEGPFEARELFEDPFVLVTPAGAPERGLRDLAGKRLLLSCAHERRAVEARLVADGIVAASYSRFDDNGMIQALVAAGEGIAVVPRLTVDRGDERVAVHSIPELPARSLVAVWHRDRQLSQSARRFADAAIELCTERAAA